MRLGGQDLEAGLRAANGAAKPSAVVTGLAEPRETTIRVRHLTERGRGAVAGGPAAVPDRAGGLPDRAEAAGAGLHPGSRRRPLDVASEFEDADLARRVGRSVVGAQVDLLASGAISGAFVVERTDDPWLAVNQTVLRIGADAAAAWNVPLVAALPIRMSGFDALEAQRLLVRALAARRPAAWLLMIDGLSEDSSVERIVASLRLALLLQAAGAPVILARAGELRRWSGRWGWRGRSSASGGCCGLRSRTFERPSAGQGRLPDRGRSCRRWPWRRSRRPRLLGAELVAETDCPCGGCAEAETLEARMAGVAEHNGHAVLREAAQLAGRSPAERVAARIGRCRRRRDGPDGSTPIRSRVGCGRGSSVSGGS